MPKAAHETITPDKTESSSGYPPMKPLGCQWEFWQGSVGISTDLTVFEGGDAVGEVGRLPDSERLALANYMIDLWTRFGGFDRDQDAEKAARREELARKYLEVEGDVMDLCRAVKVVSSVITDQLADPVSKDGPETSDYGLEVETFMVDASMVRFAVGHAAEIALNVSHKMRSDS